MFVSMASFAHVIFVHDRYRPLCCAAIAGLLMYLNQHTGSSHTTSWDSCTCNMRSVLQSAITQMYVLNVLCIEARQFQKHTRHKSRPGIHLSVRSTASRIHILQASIMNFYHTNDVLISIRSHPWTLNACQGFFFIGRMFHSAFS